MSTDNVTPTIDPVLAVLHLIAELDEIREDLPYDDLSPGFLVADETRMEIREAIPLLRSARSLLRSALDRETPRYDSYPVTESER